MPAGRKAVRSQSHVLQTRRAIHERGKFIEKGQNSAEGCRRRADDDLREAKLAATENARLIYEASAARWLERAQLMERIERTYQVKGG